MTAQRFFASVMFSIFLCFIAGHAFAGENCSVPATLKDRVFKKDGDLFLKTKSGDVMIDFSDDCSQIIALVGDSSRGAVDTRICVGEELNGVTLTEDSAKKIRTIAVKKAVAQCQAYGGNPLNTHGKINFDVNEQINESVWRKAVQGNAILGLFPVERDCTKWWFWINCKIH